MVQIHLVRLMDGKVSQCLFNQGLLLAARAAYAPDQFVAEGPGWNESFEAVTSFLNETEQPLISSWWHEVRRDPVFCYYPAASELLIQGEHDLILGLLLSSSFTRACFLVKPAQAWKELQEFPHHAWFEPVGRVFANAFRNQRRHVIEAV